MALQTSHLATRGLPPKEPRYLSPYITVSAPHQVFLRDQETSDDRPDDRKKKKKNREEEEEMGMMMLMMESDR